MLYYIKGGSKQAGLSVVVKYQTIFFYLWSTYPFSVAPSRAISGRCGWTDDYDRSLLHLEPSSRDVITKTHIVDLTNWLKFLGQRVTSLCPNLIGERVNIEGGRF